MKNKTYILFALLCTIVQGVLAQSPITWDFENEAQLNEWTLIDLDGDGYNWKYFSNTDRTSNRMTSHSGDGLMTSGSYDNENGLPLTPDNWMISREVTLGGTLSIYAVGQDHVYCDETFAVYVSVSGETEGEGSVQVDSYHFMKVGNDITTTSNMTEYAFSLREYQGMTGRFAIRHYKSHDIFMLNIDDITLDINRVTLPDPTLPTDLTVEAGSTTANVTWTDTDDASWKLRYRIFNPNQQESISWDFEGNSPLDGWDSVDADGDYYHWQAYNMSSSHSGEQGLISYSYYSNNPLTPDNWIISPEVTLNGTLSLWASSFAENYPDNFGVYVMTGTYNPDNLYANTWKKVGEDHSPLEWTQYTYDLTLLEGQKGRFAIRHYNSNDEYALLIDDITIDIPGDTPDEWTTISDINKSNYTITELTPNTMYEVQVMAYNEQKESGWSGSTVFTMKHKADEWLGSGSETDPYIIDNIQQMARLATELNSNSEQHYAGSYFTLVNDLDFTGETFTTIGTGAGIKYYFSGIFDGGGHTIKGINLNTTSGRQGVFGVVRNGGVVKNLTVKSSSIKGGDATGAIVGRLMLNSLVENCHVESDVTVNSNNYVGGVVGYNVGGTIRACSCAATVKGSLSVGGITGACESSSTVENCLYLGSSVEGTDITRTGAIVGNETDIIIKPIAKIIYSGNLYHTTANIKGIKNSDIDGSAQPGYKMSSGMEGLTFKYIDENNSRYDENCITKIGDGLQYKGEYYCKAGGSVNFKASLPTGTILNLVTSAGTLNGSFDKYKLTFAEDDAVITAIIAGDPIDITLYDHGIKAANNAAIITENNNVYANVTLSGRLYQKDGCWNSFCLPFDLVIKGSPFDGASIIVLDSEQSTFDKTTNTLTLNFTNYTEEILPAGTPCLVRWDATYEQIVDPVFNNVIIKDVEPTVTGEGNAVVNLVGNYLPFTVGEEDNAMLFLDTENELFILDNHVSVSAFHASFQLADNLVFSLIGDVNDDKTVSVADVMMLVDHCLGLANDDFHIEKANVNGDESVSVADVMALVDLVLYGTYENVKVVVNVDTGDTGIVFQSE